MEYTEKIRVLIVDESFFMRKLIREMLQAENDIEIVGEAKSGIEAIAETIRLQPDVITMDYLMPEMNGDEATKKILELDLTYQPAVLIISAFTKEGVDQTIDCLRSGAVDFIQKPSGELSLDIDKIRDEVVTKIRVAAHANVVRHQNVVLKNQVTVNRNIGNVNPSKLIIIGSSTGGPPIVENIIANLPNNLNAAFIINQHMPRFFTNSFAKRLNKISLMSVKEAESGDQILSQTVLIIPGTADAYLEKKDGLFIIKTIEVEKGQKGIHPSIDLLMNSAANIFQKNTVGIILSGMGEDGLIGVRQIREKGGYVIVQEPKSCVVDSMPCAVIKENLANEVLKPAQIVDKICSLCQ